MCTICELELVHPSFRARIHAHTNSSIPSSTLVESKPTKSSMCRVPHMPTIGAVCARHLILKNAQRRGSACVYNVWPCPLEACSQVGLGTIAVEPQHARCFFGVHKRQAHAGGIGHTTFEPARCTRCQRGSQLHTRKEQRQVHFKLGACVAVVSTRSITLHAWRQRFAYSPDACWTQPYQPRVIQHMRLSSLQCSWQAASVG